MAEAVGIEVLQRALRHLHDARYADAEKVAREYTEGRPDDPQGHYALGTALKGCYRSGDARSSFRRVLELDPGHAGAEAELFEAALWECDWDLADRLETSVRNRIRRGLEAGESVIASPHTACVRWPDPAENLAISRCVAAQKVAPLVHSTADLTLPPARPPGRRIRIGYLSGDFRDHAVAHLLGGLFGRHDRDRFEVHLYSTGRNDGSPARRRIERLGDRFVDVSPMNDLEAASRIRRDGIDVLVEMSGHTGGSRLGILWLRPARVQASWLGFPGTTGLDAIDHILADRTVLPEEHVPHFSETPVWLPGCFQANEVWRPLLPPPSRAEAGLPESAVVLASFNQSYKLDRELFSAWLELLRDHPETVLWMLDPGEPARSRLLDAADRSGVARDRLFFAPSQSREEHLRRLQLADLVLDTRFCGGHTSTSDALRAGVPVVLVQGTNFATRVGTSLLSAVGMRELACPDLATAMALVRCLVKDPDRRREVRTRLLSQLPNSDLFSPDRLVSDLESAYAEMVARADRGPPRSPMATEPRMPLQVVREWPRRPGPRLGSLTAWSGPARLAFVLAPPRTGTASLARLLAANLPEAECHHHHASPGVSGIDTPDGSTYRLFQTEGFGNEVRQFWETKLRRIEASPASMYVETSPWLMQAGLVEALMHDPRIPEVHLVALERGPADTLASLVRTFSWRGGGIPETGLIDPQQARIVLGFKGFDTLGEDGRLIWYLAELRTRVEYYRQRIADDRRFRFHRVDLGSVTADPGPVVGLVSALRGGTSPDRIKVPPPTNVDPARDGDPQLRQRLEKSWKSLVLDPSALASSYIASGRRLR